VSTAGIVTTEKADERKPHPVSGVSIRAVQFHGLTTDPSSRESSITPVDDRIPDSMATVISVGGVRDELQPPNDERTNGNGRHPRKGSTLLEETAGDAMEMATVLNEPGMKRAESSEILHLTLHQVSRFVVNVASTPGVFV